MDNTKILPPIHLNTQTNFQKSSILSPIGSPSQQQLQKIDNSPSNFKRYLPSRHMPKEALLNSVNLTKATILNKVESNMITLDDQFSKMDPEKLQNRLKDMQTKNPMQQTRRFMEFKKKPLKRAEIDFQMYKEIFVEPKEKILGELKEKEKTFEELFFKGATKQYDKILTINHDDNRQKFQGDPTLLPLSSSHLINDDNYSPNAATTSTKKKIPNFDISAKSLTLSDVKNLKAYNTMSVENLNISNISPENYLAQTIQVDMSMKTRVFDNERTFFEQQIQVQPPDTPNYNIASPLAPGNGWAPSIPLIKIDSTKTNVKDLLVRAKAGMQAGDVQKEAHLTFYLGMVHETNKNFKQAIKYYKKYFSCAQSMEDKVGMSLAMNRIGVNYYNDGKPEKSIEFHQKNLELSDRENTFAGYYNLGIAFRALSRNLESIQSFNNALDWSRNCHDLESECLCQGQLGISYLDIKQYLESFEAFKECYNLSVRLKNTKLQLDCLLNMSKISRYLSSSQAEALEIYKNAYECAKNLGDKKTVSLCLCNMGVLEGSKKFDDFMKTFHINAQDEDEDQ